jgi:ribonuclease HII
MIVIGVDEAGRGPLAGSVVAGAVILPDNFELPGLTDSKKLTEKKRQSLYISITEQCQWSVGESSAEEVDDINILQATMLAMERAVNNLAAEYDKVLVDGNRCPEIRDCFAIIKGDLSEPVISAASIIAKVTRDMQMYELDKVYPGYGFAKHKGYGTSDHLKALADFGIIIGQHRQSFAPVKRLI